MTYGIKTIVGVITTINREGDINVNASIQYQYCCVVSNNSNKHCNTCLIRVFWHEEATFWKRLEKNRAVWIVDT